MKEKNNGQVDTNYLLLFQMHCNNVIWNVPKNEEIIVNLNINKIFFPFFYIR